MAKKPSKTTAPANALAVVEQKPQALQPLPQPGAQTIVEKLLELAKDPGVDVVKINALIDANERVMAIGAKQQFDQAFAAMQGELPIITRSGLARVEKDGKLIRENSFTKDVDITQAVRPILAKYGFALRHRNAMKDGLLTVTGILSHAAGHREEDEFQTGRDDTGAKNTIQSWGSARAYGKRYTTIALLNISSEDPRDFDDDGNGADSDHGSREESERAARQAHYADDGDTRPISQGSKTKPGQRERLWVIIKNSGRNEQTLRDWLFKRYGYTSTQQIQRRHYDAICAAIEAKGPLPAGPARQPGEEG